MGKSLSGDTSSKPYQGVRVKDPVKELLRRKRAITAKASPPTTVVLPNNALSPYAHVGSSGFTGVSQSALNESTVEIGAICPGWATQPSGPTALQPLGHWAAPEYLHHDPPIPTLPSLTTDMYVQPVCPSYTVVGPPSMLTLTHTPLFTNLGTISSSSSTLPQVDVPDSSLAYIPWPQPLSSFSGPVMQRPSCPQSLSASQLLPVFQSISASVPEPDPQQVEQAPASEGTLALEKLLEDREGQKEGSYACSSSLFTEDI